MSQKRTFEDTTTTTTTTSTLSSPEEMSTVLEHPQKKKRTKKQRGHKGNNGLKGKPSNNKGHKRKDKVPRRSKLDMDLQKTTDVAENDSDVEENLTFKPISAHMYRSKFIRQWVSKLMTTVIHEDPVISMVLEHGQAETACIHHVGETPSCATVDHLRKNIKVKGQPYQLPKVQREADRHIRPYHFWMYNSGRFTREQLAQMSGKQDESVVGLDSVVNASHVCGGTCLNHAIPEPNSINQGRKKHHSQMLSALEKADVDRYKKLRKECNHIPKCFINPASRNLTELLKEKCPDYTAVLYVLK